MCKTAKDAFFSRLLHYQVLAVGVKLDPMLSHFKTIIRPNKIIIYSPLCFSKPASCFYSIKQNNLFFKDYVKHLDFFHHREPQNQSSGMQNPGQHSKDN